MRATLAAFIVALFATSALAQGVNDPPGKPSGPQGPGQHGSPGPNGNSGPLIDDGPQWLKGFVLAQGYDKDSPTDGNNGQGNDPGQSGKAPGHDRR